MSKSNAYAINKIMAKRKNIMVLDQLIGFLDGILADSDISNEEREELSKFPGQFNSSEQEPYKTLIPLIDNVVRSKTLPEKALEQITDIAIEFLTEDKLMSEETKIAGYFVGCVGDAL